MARLLVATSGTITFPTSGGIRACAFTGYSAQSHVVVRSRVPKLPCGLLHAHPAGDSALVALAVILGGVLLARPHTLRRW